MDARAIDLPRLALQVVMPIALLACAGPDDRGPSSPVAGTWRSSALGLHVEPDGGLQRRDPRGTQARGIARVDGDAARPDTRLPAPRAAIACGRGGAGDRLRRDGGSRRPVAIADACGARVATTGRRAWTESR